MDDDEANVVIATSQQKDVVEDLLTSFQDQKQIDAITNPDTLSTLEQLLPDPQEDEDGFKSSWDAVIELHGRDLVKFMEEEGTDRWKAISIVARVLIHYEFLTEGIVDSPR